MTRSVIEGRNNQIIQWKIPKRVIGLLRLWFFLLSFFMSFNFSFCCRLHSGHRGSDHIVVRIICNQCLSPLQWWVWIPLRQCIYNTLKTYFPTFFSLLYSFIKCQLNYRGKKKSNHVRKYKEIFTYWVKQRHRKKYMAQKTLTYYWGAFRQVAFVLDPYKALQCSL